MLVAHYHDARNRRRPFPNAAFDALDYREFDVSIFHHRRAYTSFGSLLSTALPGAVEIIHRNFEGGIQDVVELVEK